VSTPAALEPLFQRLYREEWGRVLASVTRMLGDLDEAETVVQDAFVAALERWRVDGAPARPGAWLLVAARRRALDVLRRRRRAPLDLESCAEPYAQEGTLADPATVTDAEVIPDDQLRLVFTCCHPALPRDAQIALTLRLVAGLSVASIARAFLVPEPAVAQRIVRAKRTLNEQGVRFEVPGPGAWPARVESVLTVVYLIFNEGYAASEGPDLLRNDLVDSAVRLGRVLVELMPADAEAWALLALMELQASRGPARTTAAGELVLLEDQDRGLWDRELVALGRAHLSVAARLGPPGPLHLQAGIAACHAEASTFAATDWTRIVALYDALYARDPSPVIALNRAVAVAMAEGPGPALALVDALLADERLAASHRTAAVRADFLRRLGRTSEAAAEYARAASLAGNERERRYLVRRAEALIDRARAVPGAPPTFPPRERGGPPRPPEPR
jgi:RNA polymerase sigma factor (sigma-70 family)